VSVDSSILQWLGGGVALAVVLWLIIRDNRSGDVAATKAAVASLTIALKRADTSSARDASENDDLRTRVATLERLRIEDHDHVNALEEQIDNQRAWRLIAVRHIQDLKAYIARHIPDRGDMPATPNELDLD
jgi:hypothetical protein